MQRQTRLPALFSYTPKHPSGVMFISFTREMHQVLPPSTGITDVHTSGILVYPNPVHQNVTVLLPSSGNVSASIELYSVDGRKYLEQMISQPKAELDLSALPSGMYFLKVLSKEGIMTGKLLKE